MARIHFIVNPSRPSIGLNWPYEEKRIAELTQDFQVHIIRGRLHAEILSRQAMDAGAELIVCVAGDSTLSEIVNGLYRASLGGAPVPALTIHAGLQRGDTIRTWNRDKDFLSFLRSFLKGEVTSEKIDLGEVEFTGEYGQRVRRLFLNGAGFGFSSLITQKLSADFRIVRSRLRFFRMMASLAAFLPPSRSGYYRRRRKNIRRARSAHRTDSQWSLWWARD